MLAKPADTVGQGEIVPRREAAAWLLARQLGWEDLVATTVLRVIPSPDTGNDTEASLQVLWPDVTPDADANSFIDEDIWRAAVLDCLIAHEDRGGHNWLAVPGSSATPRLKLVDHGFAFPHEVKPPNSTFYTLRLGLEIPEFATDGLERVMASSADSLRSLLPDEAVDAVVARAETLLAATVLEINSP